MYLEDHPLFFGVCAGVAGDGVIMDLRRADLIIGIGFEPVESDRAVASHHEAGVVSPVSIAARTRIGRMRKPSATSR